VVLNLTVANATSGAHLTAYPSGASLPGVSNLNFATNQTIANLAIIKVGSDGTIKIRNGSSRGSVNVIADVSGYFTHSTLTSATSISGSFQPLTPQRIFDTRVGLNTTKAKIPANGVRTIQIAGRGRVPLSGATSVVVHVIASSPTVNGYLTVFPGNLTTRPNASNVNFYAGKAASNAVIVKVPTSGTGAGQIKVANSGGTTDVIVDVMGWYS
jgi:hypothetical protein